MDGEASGFLFEENPGVGVKCWRTSGGWVIVRRGGVADRPDVGNQHELLADFEHERRRRVIVDA